MQLHFALSMRRYKSNWRQALNVAIGIYERIEGCMVPCRSARSYVTKVCSKVCSLFKHMSLFQSAQMICARNKQCLLPVNEKCQEISSWVDMHLGEAVWLVSRGLKQMIQIRQTHSKQSFRGIKTTTQVIWTKWIFRKWEMPSCQW